MLCPPRPKGTRARQQKTPPLTPPGVKRGDRLPRFHSCFSLEGLVTGPNRGGICIPPAPGRTFPRLPQGGLQSVPPLSVRFLAGYSSRSSRDELFRTSILPRPVPCQEKGPVSPVLGLCRDGEVQQLPQVLLEAVSVLMRYFHPSAP